MDVPVEYALVPILLTGMGAVFALYQRGVEARVKTIEDACSAKDAEITWLRKQNEGWTEIAQSNVRVNEKLVDAAKVQT